MADCCVRREMVFRPSLLWFSCWFRRFFLLFIFLLVGCKEEKVPDIESNLSRFLADGSQGDGLLDVSVWQGKSGWVADYLCFMAPYQKKIFPFGEHHNQLPELAKINSILQQHHYAPLLDEGQWRLLYISVEKGLQSEVISRRDVPAVLVSTSDAMTSLSGKPAVPCSRLASARVGKFRDTNGALYVGLIDNNVTKDGDSNADSQ